LLRLAEGELFRVQEAMNAELYEKIINVIATHRRWRESIAHKRKCHFGRDERLCV
jgi:hypothetical protein